MLCSVITSASSRAPAHDGSSLPTVMYARSIFAAPPSISPLNSRTCGSHAATAMKPRIMKRLVRANAMACVAPIEKAAVPMREVAITVARFTRSKARFLAHRRETRIAREPLRAVPGTLGQSARQGVQRSLPLACLGLQLREHLVGEADVERERIEMLFDERAYSRTAIARGAQSREL